MQTKVSSGKTSKDIESSYVIRVSRTMSMRLSIHPLNLCMHARLRLSYCRLRPKTEAMIRENGENQEKI